MKSLNDLFDCRPQFLQISDIKLSKGHKSQLKRDKSEVKIRKRAKIRNRYNQAPNLTKDAKKEVTTSQLDITNESQEVSPFPAGARKASINRRAQKHYKNKMINRGERAGCLVFCVPRIGLQFVIVL